MLEKVEIKRKRQVDNQRISCFIPTLLKKYSEKKYKISEEIEEIYKESAGKEIAAVSSVIKFENCKLTIKVKDAVWKNELKFLEEKIKNSINSNKNIKQVVNKIIFK